MEVNMNRRRSYFIEVGLLLILLILGIQWIKTNKSLQEKRIQFQNVNEFNQIVTNLLLETLMINSENSHHYDWHAQLQLDFEQNINSIQHSTKLMALANELNLTIANYMQIATMLKTSRRFVASQQKSASTNALYDKNVANELFAQILQFHISPSNIHARAIEAYMKTHQAKLSATLSHGISWPMLQKHIEFILANQRLSEQLREKIQFFPLLIFISEEISIIDQNSRILMTTRNNYLLGWLTALFSILLTTLTRQATKLRTKTKQAQAASEVKAQFLANMSHEIRTPMNGILGLTDICLNSDISDSNKHYLEKIKFSARSLTTIINDILDFSKIESNKLTIEYVDFELHELFSNIKIMLGQTAATKQIELVFDLSSSLPNSIHCDPVRFGQILLNLCSNAVKFTNDGQILVSVSLITDDSQWLEVSITDDGIGMTEEQMARLFGRFNQAESSTTRKYGGTGLGLAITKQLLELMGGNITVTSTIGKGSTFKFRLPYVKAKLLSEEKLQIENLSDKLLLIVDDHQLTLTITERMAKTLKMNVACANTIEQANELIAKHKFDFALIDWQLQSGQHGIELLKQFNFIEHPPTHSFIFTAFDSLYLREELTDYPKVKILNKPITMHEIAKAFMSVLNQNVPTQPRENISAEYDAVDNTEDELTFKKRVLLVEDNEINQLVAVKLLSQYNIELDVAGNGQDALNKLSTESYDLIFMDIQMPIMDGVEATKRIRQNLSSEILPIVALTANVMSEDIEHYKSIGINECLGKPFEQAELENIVNHYLFNK
jgi:signal transduction histidine kinase/CheY-like chemotaxis protein